MSKKLVSKAKSYAKNITLHALRVAKRTETPRDAIKGLSRDTVKLKRAIKTATTPVSRKEAVDLTKAGREAYNHKNYKTAERIFREAIDVDPTYALAYTFLGHTMYKRGQTSSAVKFWNKAIEAEPNSPAAAKARKKIQHVEKSRLKTSSQISKRLRKHQ